MSGQRDAVFYLTTVNQTPKPPEPFKAWFAKAFNDGRGWDAITRDIITATGPTEKDKIPVRPFVDDLVQRGDDVKNYVPSLDPVRVAGKVVSEK